MTEYELTIIIDTKEKKVEHITKYLDAVGVKYIRRSIKTGDISAILTYNGIDYDLSEKFAIERKANIAELIQNLCTKEHRPRFEAEFQRAEEAGTRIEIMIEQEDWYRRIIEGDYGNGYHKSKASVKQIRGSISYWQQRYNLTITGVSKACSGAYILDRIIWVAKDFLYKNRLL